MTLHDFALLTDENLDPEVVAHLRRIGFDVVDVREEGLSGTSDVALLRQANALRRVVMTQDSDFGTLAIASGEPITGIVFLRPGHISAQFTIDTLKTLLAVPLELVPPFVVVAKRTGERVTIRIRHLGRDSDAGES